MAGFNRFRKIRPEDTAIITTYEKEAEHFYRKELESVAEEEREAELASQIKIEQPQIIKKIKSRKTDDNK